MKNPALRSSSLHTEAAGFVPPDAFGRFRVLHQIGAGTLGPVFRAYEPDRGRLVVIKLFRLDLPPDRVHRLVDEFERLLGIRLTHSTLVAPLAAGIHDSSPYLVQEFVSAESLDVIVRDYGPPPPVDTVGLALQLAGALDFAAGLAVFAGALHPRDVLASPEEARITGLGVLTALERVGVSAPIRRPFSAPERVAGRPWDRRADIYSLAAILHEVLWGRRIVGTAAQVVDTLTALPGAQLDALRDAFARALAEEPRDRFETAMEFATALKAAFPAIAPTAAPQERTRPEPERAEPAAPVAAAAPAETPPAGEAATAGQPGAITEAPDHEVNIAPVSGDTVEANLDLPLDDEQGLELIAHEEPQPPAPAPLPVTAANLPSVPPSDMHAGSQAHSAMWPLALALIVGMALGFAGGYGFGMRDRGGPSAVAAGGPADQNGPPAREYTESAVPDGKNVVTPPPVPAPESARSSESGSTPRTGPHAVPSAPAESDTGRLLVRSTPAGARVFIDGRDRGRTPASVRDLSDGAHRLRVVQEGYQTEERRIVIAPSHRAQSMTVALVATRAPARASAATVGSFYGSLSVASRPAGAAVFVDGRPMGRTPVVVPQIGAGEHAVRLEHEGYRRWSSSVRIVSGERNRVTASLER